MVIRSVVGRWAGPSNFELAAPAGLATDRAGNLYTADAAASAIYALRGGKLELMAQVAAPGAIAVDSAGTRVYVASPAQGRVFAVDTAGVVGNSTANQDRRPDAGPTAGGIRVVAELAEQGPAGLAVDAAGNLFMADAVANVIRRIDARTAVSTIVAGTGATGDAGDGGPATRAELNAPTGLAFDAAGNLFVADEGNRSIREITSLGPEQASGSVTLSPASVNFGDQLTGGTTASQAFTLTNGTSAALTGISLNFTGANPGDFSSTNSCGSMLAAMSSCHINVTFAPHSTGVRSATLSVADSDPSTPQTASVSGTGDDFELVPQSASSLTTLNIISGATATFMLAVKPDSIFSGKVTFICPSNLPAQTTCTFSPASVAVTPGNSQNFTAAFATTLHQVVPGANEQQFPAPPRGWLIAFAAIIVLVVCERDFLGLGSCPSAARRGLALAIALGTALAFAGGCYKKKYKPVTGTQAGTYNLTISGTAQNASRGITVTINVQ